MLLNVLTWRLFQKIEMTSFPYMKVMSHRRAAQNYIAALIIIFSVFFSDSFAPQFT